MKKFKLLENDFDRCVEFYEIMTIWIIKNPNVITNVFFSDEAPFMLNGNIN